MHGEQRGQRWQRTATAHRFTTACQRGDLLAVQILTTLGNLSTHLLLDGAKTACGSGHMQLMECFHECMDLQPVKQTLLRIACNSRRQEMVWWVVQRLQPALEDAFAVACSHMGLGLAKWLWARGGVDLHFSEDSAFVGACESGRLDTARWLVSLHPEWAWPGKPMQVLKTWSPSRDGWLRAVIKPRVAS
jgi:hypothetical protein